MGCPFQKKGNFFQVLYRKVCSLVGYGHIVRSGSSAMLFAVMDNTVDAIVSIGEDSCILNFNKAAEQMFGYTLLEVLGQNVNMLMPLPYREHHDEYIRHYLDTGKRKIIGIGREIVAQRKNAEIFPIRLAVSEVFVENKKIFTGIVRDLSVERSLTLEKERMQEEMKVKTQFLTSMSHELRTPLHAIMGFTECLIKEMDGPLLEEQRKSLQHIYSAGEHLLGLINGLLMLSRLAKDREVALRSECAVGEILLSCLATLSPLACKKNLQIKTNILSGSCVLLANPEGLRQIFFNLIGNAIKYSDQGTITITLQKSPEMVSVSIADMGIGIDQADLSKIFFPLGRPFKDAKRQQEQGGLGLAITKALIEELDGTITVSSKKGVGSIFVVCFPVNKKEKKNDY